MRVPGCLYLPVIGADRVCLYQAGFGGGCSGDSDISIQAENYYELGQPGVAE